MRIGLQKNHVYTGIEKNIEIVKESEGGMSRKKENSKGGKLERKNEKETGRRPVKDRKREIKAK